MSNFVNIFPRAQLKQQAKQLLSPNWGVILGITIIYGVLVLLTGGGLGFASTDSLEYAADYATSTGDFSYMAEASGLGLGSSLLTFVLGVLVNGVLAYCYTAYFVKSSQMPNQKLSFSTFVEGFNDAVRAALAYLWRYLWIAIWGLTAVPGIIILSAGVIDGSAGLIAVGSLLAIAGGVLGALAAVRFFFMYQIIADSRGTVGARLAMKYSIAIAKDHVGDLILLFISFIPWSFVGILTFGFGMLYVMPYMEMTYALSYQWFRDEAFRSGHLDPAALGYARKETVAQPQM